MTMTFSSTVDREKSPSNSAEEQSGTPGCRVGGGMEVVVNRVSAGMRVVVKGTPAGLGAMAKGGQCGM